METAVSIQTMKAKEWEWVGTVDLILQETRINSIHSQNKRKDHQKSQNM